MKRYGDVSFIMSLDVDYGVDMVVKAREEQQEDELFSFYIHKYPVQTEPMTYSQFKKHLEENAINKNKDTRCEEEVLADAENILKSMKRS